MLRIARAAVVRSPPLFRYAFENQAVNRKHTVGTTFALGRFFSSRFFNNVISSPDDPFAPPPLPPQYAAMCSPIRELLHNSPVLPSDKDGHFDAGASSDHRTPVAWEQRDGVVGAGSVFIRVGLLSPKGDMVLSPYSGSGYMSPSGEHVLTCRHIRLDTKDKNGQQEAQMRLLLAEGYTRCYQVTAHPWVFELDIAHPLNFEEDLEGTAALRALEVCDIAHGASHSVPSDQWPLTDVMLLRVSPSHKQKTVESARRLPIPPLQLAGQLNDGDALYTLGYPKEQTIENVLKGQAHVPSDDGDNGILTDLEGSAEIIKKVFFDFSVRVCSIGETLFVGPSGTLKLGQHTCDAIAGMNGGPIFDKNGHLVGLHIGSQRGASARYNLFYPVVSNIALAKILKRHFSKPPSSLNNPRRRLVKGRKEDGNPL